MAKEITQEEIMGWIQKIREKFPNHSKCAPEFTQAWVAGLCHYGAKIVLEDDFYFMYGLNNDAFGNTGLMIISACSDSVAGFFKMQKAIEAKARELTVDYIAQGSEIDDRYNKWLVAQGYKPYSFRKEL